MDGQETDSGDGGARWPPLPLEAWAETCDTLHLWTQMAGKVAVELCPFLHQWWHVALHSTPRGLSTVPIPSRGRVFTIDFDFIDHNLRITVSDGRLKALPLIARSVADLYGEFLGALAALDISVTINPMPVEIPGAVRFDHDHDHASYDPEAVARWWRVLLQTTTVLEEYRSSFVGKNSPVLFYWGSFDLNEVRFSGRPATPPAGAPRFMQLAENQENAACGFWPGNVTAGGVTLGLPAFYAYTYPEPPGYKAARVQPAAAYYDPQLGEFILPYDEVRRAASPEQDLLAFFQSTYKAGATLGGWDRDTLEQTHRGGRST